MRDAQPRRRLTHVELVHRPGERAEAIAFFELLGCRVVDRGGHFFTAFVDPTEGNYSENVFYASEVTAAQWAFEESISQSSASADFAAARRRQPQHTCHVGFAVPSEAAHAEIVERVTAAAANHPTLAARVRVDGVFRPGDPGAIAPNMVQAFVWTDVVTCGLLLLGQHIEVQWHMPDGP